MSLKHLLTVLGLICAVCSVAWGRISFSPDFGRLTNEADSIVVADISRQHLSPEQVSQPGQMTVVVRRVLKGHDLVPGMVKRVSWQGGASLSANVFSASEALLIFLRLRDGNWEPLSSLAPISDLADFCIPVPRTALPGPSYAPGSSAVDKVADELVRALEGAPDSPSYRELYNASLETLDSPVFTSFYGRLAQKDTVALRVLGIAGLIRRGNSTAVTLLEDSWKELARSPESWLLDYSLRVYYRSTELDGIAALGRLAMNPAVKKSLKESSAFTLATIHTASTLPYFSEMLESPDPEVQEFGVKGMGMFANFGPTPNKPKIPFTGQILGTENAPFRKPSTIENFIMGPDALRSDRVRYVQYWKNWWASNRSQIIPDK